MHDSDLMPEVVEIFREVFGDPELVVKRETNATNIADWDSFAQINLVVAFEEKFNISFDTREISSLTCVGEMEDLVKRKTAAS